MRVPTVRSRLLDPDPLAKVVEIMGGYGKVIEFELAEFPPAEPAANQQSERSEAMPKVGRRR